MVVVNGLIRPADCVVFIAQTGLLGDELPPNGSRAGHEKMAACAATPGVYDHGHGQRINVKVTSV